MKANTIYIFTNSYKPVLGGVQTVSSQFAEECLGRGYKTFVVTNLYPRHLKVYERIGDVPILRIPFGNPDGNIVTVLKYIVSLVILTQL